MSLKDVDQKPEATCGCIRGNEEKTEKCEKCYDKARDAPDDVFNMSCIIFLLTGLITQISTSFFIGSTNYWMYKFRNVTLNTTDADYRTNLQVFFTSSTTTMFTITTVITSVICTLYAYKFNARKRLICGLSVQTTMFVISTAFVKINTDTWQEYFFGLIMIFFVCIHAAATLNVYSSYAILTTFPLRYTTFFLYGQIVSQIFSSLLQMLCLSIGDDSETVALIYFTTGTTLNILTLLLTVYANKFKHFGHYVSQYTKGKTSYTYTWLDFKEIFGYGSQSIITSALVFVELAFTNASIAPLIVSEYDETNSRWADFYFVPTVTFFLSSVVSLLGRMTAAVFHLESLSWFQVFLYLLSVAVFTPAVMFCNARPRHHMPVLFPHDWEYALIVILKSATNGLYHNMSVYHLRKSIPSEKMEKAFNVQMTIVGLMAACTSPLSLLAVKLI